MTKKAALAKFLSCKQPELKKMEWDHYGLSQFEYGNAEYSIGTNEEADAATKENILNLLWAFNSYFLASQTGLDEIIFKTLQESEIREDNINYAIGALIKSTCGLDKIVDEAISTDGHGHFLSAYDGTEHEEGNFFIYRN